MSDCTLALHLGALKVSYSDVGEGGVAVNCEKPQFFLNTLYENICKYIILISIRISYYNSIFYLHPVLICRRYIVAHHSALAIVSSLKH